MTGFGRGEKSSDAWKFSLEMRAVNHRFCEVAIRMPRVFMQLEDNIRRKVKTKVARGKVDVYVNIDNTANKDYTVKVDKGLAVAYYRAIKDLQADTGIGGGIEIEHLINLPGIVEIQEDEYDIDELWPLIDGAMDDALQQLVFMRESEGAELARDLLERSRKIMTLAGCIEEHSPLVVQEYKDKLQLRLGELLTDGTVDSDRLAQEVAIFADKCDITEELVRLKSHLSQLDSCLEGSSPVGRKLDFLLQELLREINTIGSKANDARIGNLVVELKSELEKIREQVQNIE
ncbi:MAG TPA: YicC/YloC family endoribonuclease [Clostridia bacterium]|nr:YicC/YloC family endoribonuclease [Clostridia bacterium]